jgi:hypothetical protein
MVQYGWEVYVVPSNVRLMANPEKRQRCEWCTQSVGPGWTVTSVRHKAHVVPGHGAYGAGEVGEEGRAWKRSGRHVHAMV